LVEGKYSTAKYNRSQLTLPKAPRELQPLTHRPHGRILLLQLYLTRSTLRQSRTIGPTTARAPIVRAAIHQLTRVAVYLNGLQQSLVYLLVCSLLAFSSSDGGSGVAIAVTISVLKALHPALASQLAPGRPIAPKCVS
jgi:hypothetical protein